VQRVDIGLAAHAARTRGQEVPVERVEPGERVAPQIDVDDVVALLFVHVAIHAKRDALHLVERPDHAFVE